MKKFLSLATAAVSLCSLFAFAGCETIKEVEVEVPVYNTYCVNITGGTATYDEEENEITAVANVPSDSTFVEWQDAEGNRVSTDREYVFDAADATLIAVYKKKADTDLSAGILDFTTDAAFVYYDSVKGDAWDMWDGGDWVGATLENQTEVTNGSNYAMKLSAKITNEDGTPNGYTGTAPDWWGVDYRAVYLHAGLETTEEMKTGMANVNGAGTLEFDVRFENFEEIMSFDLIYDNGTGVFDGTGNLGYSSLANPGRGVTMTKLYGGWYHFTIDLTTHFGAESFAEAKGTVTHLGFGYHVGDGVDGECKYKMGVESVIYFDNMVYTPAA